MNNQTFKNDPDNRDEKANIKLKKVLRSLWLEMRDSNKQKNHCNQYK